MVTPSEITELGELKPSDKFILFPNAYVSGQGPRDEHEVFMKIKWMPDILSQEKPGYGRAADAISLKTGEFVSFHPLEKIIKLAI